jgi:hypothetical protein
MLLLAAAWLKTEDTVGLSSREEALCIRCGLQRLSAMHSVHVCIYRARSNAV